MNAHETHPEGVVCPSCGGSGWKVPKSPGRPRSVPGEVVDLITRLSGDGLSAYAIARELDRLEIPTAHGAANWSRATVSKLLQRGLAGDS